MEEQTMMSNIPVFETISIPNGSNPVVQVAPMEQTAVDGNFNNWSESDSVQVPLQAGEILTAGLVVKYDVMIHSGPMDGTNNEIKTMKRQAYGFRDLELFKLKILAIHETKYVLMA
jgi:Transposase